MLLKRLAGPKWVVELEMAFRPLPEYQVWQADVGCVSAKRDKATGDDEYLMGAPELIGEVLSPSNTRSEINDKMSISLNNRCVSFWVVDPKRKLVSVTEGNATRHQYFGLILVQPVPRPDPGPRNLRVELLIVGKHGPRQIFFPPRPPFIPPSGRKRHCVQNEYDNGQAIHRAVTDRRHCQDQTQRPRIQRAFALLAFGYLYHCPAEEVREEDAETAQQAAQKLERDRHDGSLSFYNRDAEMTDGI